MKTTEAEKMEKISAVKIALEYKLENFEELGDRGAWILWPFNIQ